MRVLIQSKDGYVVADLNRRRAIRKKCLICVGFSSFAVKTCAFKGKCALFAFRHGTGKQDAKAREQAIRDFCADCMGGLGRHGVKSCVVSDCPLYPYRFFGLDRSVELPREFKIGPYRGELPTQNAMGQPYPLPPSLFFESAAYSGHKHLSQAQNQLRLPFTG